MITTAVIGHGRSPEGKGWGPRIDNCSRVVRMWDWYWQAPADYGERYDYGLLALYPKGLEVFWNRNKHVPARGYLGYRLKVTGTGRLPNGMLEVDQTPWVRLAHSLGGRSLSGKLNLTRGTAAACWAIDNSGPLDAVLLVGFDNVHLGYHLPKKEAFSKEYWDIYIGHFAHNAGKVYPEGGTKTATHDMAIERPLLERLASNRRVALNFAQDAWV